MSTSAIPQNQRYLDELVGMYVGSVNLNLISYDFHFIYIYIKSTKVRRYKKYHMKGTGTILIDEFEKDITLWIMVM